MKRIQSIAAVALLAAAPAYAQTYEATPRGLPDSFMPHARELTQPAPFVTGPAAPPTTVTITKPPVDRPPPPQLVMNVKRHQKDADARRCLQASSNKQIHRCAERYRPHGASVTRTKAAKTTPAAAAPKSKVAADIGKADLSKAGAPAKPADTTARPAPATAPPPTTASVIQKPTATPVPAAPQKAETKSDRPPKWTDTAKGVMKSQGNHLPD
jgi:hypothetical protein